MTDLEIPALAKHDRANRTPPSASASGRVKRAARCAALLMCSATAQAATFTFSGATDSGPLLGTAFTGQFSFSDTGVPADGDTPLTAFSLSFAGQTYTLAGATALASANFAGGSFIGLSFVDDASADTSVRPQVSFTPGYTALSESYLAYVGAGSLGGFGSYAVTAVPEPGSLALWLAGVALLGVATRRQR